MSLCCWSFFWSFGLWRIASTQLIAVSDGDLYCCLSLLAIVKIESLAAGTSSFRDGGGKLCQGGFSLVFLFYLNTCCNTLHILLDTLQSVQSAPGKSLDISGVIHPSYLVHAFPFVSPADAFNCQPLLLAFQEVAEELWSPSGEGWNKGAQQCYDIFLHWIGFGKNGLFPPVR